MHGFTHQIVATDSIKCFTLKYQTNRYAIRDCPEVKWIWISTVTAFTSTTTTTTTTAAAAAASTTTTTTTTTSTTTTGGYS